MPDDSDRRVEPKHLQLSAGLTATPERIAELQERVEKLDRVRPKPKVNFSAVLAKKGQEKTTEPELDEKEKKMRELPKKGPRPGLVHPHQKNTYGREEDPEDCVVLKG